MGADGRSPVQVQLEVRRLEGWEDSCHVPSEPVPAEPERRFDPSMSRFGDGEYKVFATGRLLHLFDKGFVSTKASIKECIFEAIPGFPRDIADRIEQSVKDHIRYDTGAQDMIRRYNLTLLEAESITWWTVDGGMAGMDTEESPYHVLNSHLRARDTPKIKKWRDFSYFFISALEKLPPVETTSFRGEKKRVTELSKQYAKDNPVMQRERKCAPRMDALRDLLVGAQPIFSVCRWHGYRSTPRRRTAARPCGSSAAAGPSSSS